MTPAAHTPPSVALHEDLALLTEAAAEAGRIALRYFGKSPDVWMKDGTSPVSEADIEIDRFLMGSLMGARPDYGWLSEETADDSTRLTARRTFVVDPIDGTRAFIDGRPTWCVSIAIVEGGKPLAGVLDCPAKSEVYSAAAGLGAFKNGLRLRIAEPTDRFRIAGAKPILDLMPAHLQDRVDRISYIPSLAYRVAMVADGSLHATFVKPNSHDWDLAAADLILSEAGGRVVDEKGLPLRYGREAVKHGALAAGTAGLLPMLVDVLNTFGAPS